MAVILPPEYYETWLHDDSDPDELKAVLQPHDDGPTYYEVSTPVNSPRNDKPEILDPYNAPEQGTLF